jgi:ABC-2 type transport system ATP-binding protein
VEFEVLVSCEEVSFSYRRRSALREVSWCFGSGVTGLLGPNGAGKTTLLSLLVTLGAPASGQILLGEHDLDTTAGRAAGRRVLGYVPQRFSLASEMRVRDTVSYAGWVNGLPERNCAAAADRALAEVGLTDKSRARVRSLSGGQRQRLGIAAALAHDPELVVLDEPTVGLDPGQRLRVRELIAKIGQDRTVVISSHLLEDISRLCRRVGVLAEGRLVFDGTVGKLTELIDEINVGENALGSSFERAYDALLAKLGGEE